MAHSDDKGLVLPPNLAPIQVVIVPIYKGDSQLDMISETALGIKADLEKRGISVKYDDRDTHKPGFKFADYELKGVTPRIAIGPRDIENGTVEIARRDTLSKETINRSNIDTYIADKLEEIQNSIFDRSLKFRDENIFTVDTWEEFKAQIEKGGFISAHWDGSRETEDKIKQETKATIRVIPFDAKEESGSCIYSGLPSSKRVIFARAY